MKVKVITKENIYEVADKNTVDNEVFYNVKQVDDNIWYLFLNGYQIAELWDQGKIVYYPETQRGTKIKKLKNGEVKSVAICNEKNIKEIQSAIKGEDNKKFYPSQITLNLLEQNNEVAIYNFEDKTLKLTGVLTMLDGNHRTRAMHRLYLYSKVLGEDCGYKEKLEKLEFPILLTHFQPDEAKSVFSQFAKGLKISTSKAESFDMSRASNRIVNKLNNHGSLKGMIDENKTSISKSDEKHIVTFATLNNAIKESFPIIQSQKEENDIYEFLDLFFKELKEIFPEMLSYEHRSLSREYSLVCENITFYGYLAIARLLYVKRFQNTWKDELKNIKKIDMDKESEIWTSIIRPGKTGLVMINNKQTRSILSKILEEEFYKVQ